MEAILGAPIALFSLEVYENKNEMILLSCCKTWRTATVLWALDDEEKQLFLEQLQRSNTLLSAIVISGF